MEFGLLFLRRCIVAEVPFYYASLGFTDYFCKYYGLVYKINLETYVPFYYSIDLPTYP